MERRDRENNVVGPPEVLVPGTVRARHNAVLLRLLWAHGEISRAELARRTGLSRSTVSAIVSDILATGVVRETRPGSSRGGRRPIMLGFEDNARTIVGLDIGASHVGGVLTNLRGQIIGRTDRLLWTREDPQRALDEAIDVAKDLIRMHPAKPLGVGVAMPAPLDPSSRRPLATVMPAWGDIDVADAIERRLQQPVRLENDANLGALAEQWWGAGRQRGDLVFVKVATGIGAGLIIGGKIFSGVHGIAGELGHLSVDPNGPPCMCGVNGCLNVVIGTQALLARARARLQHFPESPLAQATVDLQALIEAARANDPLALEIIRFAGERLGDGLANLLNVLDPSTIVIGGELTEVGEPLLDPIRKKVMSRTLVASQVGARVVCSQIDRQSVALGAATLILRAVLDTLEIPLTASGAST